MKKFVLFLFATVVLSLMTVSVFASDISIKIMGKELQTDEQAQIVDGRTMVPVRAIFEGIGAEVSWDSNTKTITGEKDGNIVKMVINSNIIEINGNESTMDSSPLIIYGRTYAPARYVAESFGLNVDWDSNNRVVSITGDNIEVKNTKEENETVTEEISTEEITEETTEIYKEEYESYSSYYKGSNLAVGKDLPTGRYVLITDTNKTAYISIYEYGNTKAIDTGDKRYVYSKGCEYQDVVELRDKQYVNVTSGALVPTELVPQRNVSRNGTFRVGTDLPAGHYTFRLDESTCTGYLEVKGLSDNSAISNYKFNEDKIELVLKLENGTVIKKYGLDMLDSSLRMFADYTPVFSINSDLDTKYNFSDVRESYKNNIIKELTDEIKLYSSSSYSSARYRKDYIDKKISTWKTQATNSAESKYADIAGQIYTRFYYFTYYSHPEYSKFSTVVVYNNNYSGSQYKKLLEYDRDAYYNFVMSLSTAQNFDNCDTVRYNTHCLYYAIPYGQGWGKN
ncbi:MAG: stalk domain-containing protein [Lachnospirales bacterium]